MTGCNACASIRRYIVEFVNILDSLQRIHKEQKKYESTGTINQNHGEMSPRSEPALFPPANLVGDQSEKRTVDLSSLN